MQQALGIGLILSHPRARVMCMHSHVASVWVLGIQIQDLRVAEEAFSPVEPLYQVLTGSLLKMSTFACSSLFTEPCVVSNAAVDSFGNHFWGCYGSSGAHRILLPFSALWMFFWYKDVGLRSGQGSRANKVSSIKGCQGLISIPKTPSSQASSLLPCSLTQTFPICLFWAGAVGLKVGTVCLRASSASFSVSNE